MVEKIKSVVLAILVFSSLFLTYQLWYSKQPAELIVEDTYERVIMEPPRPLDEVFFPSLLTIATEDGWIIPDRENSGFKAIWEVVRNSIATLEKDPQNIAAVIAEGEKLAVLYFKPLLPAGQDYNWTINYPSLRISQIFIQRHENQLWMVAIAANEEAIYARELQADMANPLEGTIAVLKDSQAVTYFQLSEDLFYLSGEASVVIQDPIFLPTEPLIMTRLALKPETYNRDQLLKTFFVDYSLARIIEEKDGGLIYTDGEKGLRLTSSSIEYSNPRLEQTLVNIEYYDALVNCNNYISYHGGWLPGLRLETLEMTGWNQAGAYAGQWRMYFSGYPLFTSIPTKVILNDRGMVHFSRSLYHIDESIQLDNTLVETANWLEALEKAVVLLDEERAGLRSYLRVEAMRPAYAAVNIGQSIIAEPVWFIQVNGKRFFLKADSLAQIKEGELM